VREDEHSPWPGNACDPRRSLLCEPVVVPHCTFRWLGSIICRTPSLANHSRPSGDVEATDWNVAWAGWALSNTSNVLTLIFVSGYSYHPAFQYQELRRIHIGWRAK
jgi:hypothetical protein